METDMFMLVTLTIAPLRSFRVMSSADSDVYDVDMLCMDSLKPVVIYSSLLTTELFSLQKSLELLYTQFS